MHVPVAPACNIQCRYCNRKYDCANESRPGVVSEVLTPQQAAHKALAIAARIPQMSVVGIAGPGDPLANPQRTFATLRMLAERAPDIKLCVSTNGLVLPEYVDALVEHGVEHVTVTVNCVDPDVGAQIYPWIFWRHQRVRGRRASEILIEQQQKGLEMLAARGVLVKVNSVMIPGVNDTHLREVSRVVKARGALLHNVMPLIAEPQHGTFFGIMGQRGPTRAELAALQESCAGDMTLMRHCRQCRADAVGMLDEDRSAEFTRDKVAQMEVDPPAAITQRVQLQAALEAQLRAAEEAVAGPSSVSKPKASAPMLIAVASRSGRFVDQHFGHADEFYVYKVSQTGAVLCERRTTAAYCTGAQTCGDGEAALERSLRALTGCRAVLAARIGLGPWERLEAAGIMPSGEYAMEPIEDAVVALYCELVQVESEAAVQAAGA
jgi:nitrogen fixation protein NifB